MATVDQCHVTFSSVQNLNEVVVSEYLIVAHMYNVHGPKTNAYRTSVEVVPKAINGNDGRPRTAVSSDVPYFKHFPSKRQMPREYGLWVGSVSVLVKLFHPV